MELTPLRYVVALAREKHFLRAARRAHVSQPTLSQQVMKLERELGVRLFERSPRRVRLTAAGERFLPRAREILQAVDNATEAARDPARPPEGRLTVGAIPTVAPFILPPVLRSLRRAAPRLSLELHELTTSLLVAHLQEGLVDIGLLALPITERGLTARPLGREPFRLAVAPGHPLAARRAVSRRDLRGERLLILQEGHCFRNQSLDFCRLQPTDPQVIFQGSGLGSVLKMAEAGEGVTLVPALAVDPRSPLRFIPFTAPAPGRELGLLWRSTLSLSRSHKIYMETVAEEVGRRLGGRGGTRP